MIINIYFIGTCTYSQVAYVTPTGWETVAPPERATYRGNRSVASNYQKEQQRKQTAVIVGH